MREWGTFLAGRGNPLAKGKTPRLMLQAVEDGKEGARMSLKEWFRKKSRKNKKMTAEDWGEFFKNNKIDTTPIDENAIDNLLQYCPYCGHVTTQTSDILCVYCKHKMVKIPKEQLTTKEASDLVWDYGTKVGKETGKYPSRAEYSWEDVANERLHIQENPLFNLSLYNLRRYEQGKSSEPHVECPACGSMNTYFLNPDRKTEYTGLFGGTDSNFGKTFGCVTCGHKW